MPPPSIESMAAIAVFVSWQAYWIVTRFGKTIHDNRQDMLKKTGVCRYSFADGGFRHFERHE